MHIARLTEAQHASAAFPGSLPFDWRLMLLQMLLALKKGQNALLEAPTGCGKTLSLLCAALAWQESQRAQLAAEQLQLTAVKRQSDAPDGPAPDLDNFRCIA